MKRHLARFICWVLILLAAANVVLATLSFWRVVGYAIIWSGEFNYLEIRIANGFWQINYGRGTGVTLLHSEYVTYFTFEPATSLSLSIRPAWYGFGYRSGSALSSVLNSLSETTFVGSAAWALVILLPFPLFCGLAEKKRQRLKLQGRCVFCGYDLRASPDRCPECGHTPYAEG